MSTQPERKSTKSHTPGPWSYQPNGQGWNNLCGPDGRSIWTGSARTDEDDANRALISTAPELLQALKASIDVIQLMQSWAREVSDQYLDGDPQTRFDYAADLQSANEAVRLYQAFIAKAEGR